MKKNKQFQKGSALILTVVFFTIISLSISVGLISPTISSARSVKDSLESKRSYALAESGIEDAYFRIKNSKQISAVETVSDGERLATTTITTIGSNQKQIDSVGDAYLRQRNIRMTLMTGSGAVFHYGTQAGQGGIKFNNNSGLYGDLYTNGSIDGANGSFVTGNVLVANSPALNADQQNTQPMPATQSITFGNTNSTQDLAQSFQLSTSGLANKVQFYIRKVGSPGNVTVRLVGNNNGNPSGTTIASGVLNAQSVTSTYGWVDVAFSSSTPYLSSGITYWVVIDGPTNASNYYISGASTSYTSGAAKVGQQGGAWNQTNPVGLDAYFQFYLGGVNSYINNVDIGGYVKVNTLTNSTITGIAYCQSGSGNNKSCDTSQSDPTPQSMPISDANIDQWESDALLGGTINGNYTISTPTTLGPKKIIGDLTVNSTLTISDTIWVTGNVFLNGTVKLASSYGTTTGIIISDGYMNISNGVNFQDSGQAGSFIMLLSKSVCDGDTAGNPCGSNDAINANNNSSIVIAVANKGTVSFNNNAGVKEVVANRIKLKNNASITYGSGMMNVGFSSGPTGGWNVASWKEVQ